MVVTSPRWAAGFANGFAVGVFDRAVGQGAGNRIGQQSVVDVGCAYIVEVVGVGFSIHHLCKNAPRAAHPIFETATNQNSRLKQLVRFVAAEIRLLSFRTVLVQVVPLIVVFGAWVKLKDGDPGGEVRCKKVFFVPDFKLLEVQIQLAGQF